MRPSCARISCKVNGTHQWDRRERGLYMIEIIREESFDSEQEKRELPKNIRQIGSPDIGDRIYIENKVHEYMHPYDALQEKTV